MDEQNKSMYQHLMDKLSESFKEPEPPLMVNGKLVDRKQFPQFQEPAQQLQPNQPIQGNPFVNPQEGLKDLKEMFNSNQPQDPRFQKLVKPKY
jgi:hypothetical protein